MIIRNGIVLDENFVFHRLDVEVQGERIVAVAEKLPDGQESLDAQGQYVIPGLFDIHTHGCAGHESLEGSIEALQAMADYYGQNGVTSHLCTTGTAPNADLLRVYRCVKEYMASERSGSSMMGINMEGVFFSRGKKGAHSADLLKDPDIELFMSWWEASGGAFKMCCVAPELPGAKQFIGEIKQLCTVSMAHTAASYTTAMESFNWGITHATHTFNGMAPFLHREPGPVGAIFDSKTCFAELISDGYHIHPAVVRLMFQVLGEDRICLVSDSMEATGMPDGIYTKKGKQITVRDGHANLSDGTIAGSTHNLMQDMKSAVSFGVPLVAAIKAATINPSKSMRLEHLIGSIAVGKRADMVVLKRDELTPLHVMARGKLLKRGRI